MNETEHRAAEAETNTEATLAQSAPDTACPHCAKKLAKQRKKAEQIAAYREQVSEVTLQNAEYLAALASYATSRVPSANDAIQKIVQSYSTSMTNRIAKI